MDYLHLNPVRARLVRPEACQSLLDYPWSSVAEGYAVPPRRRPEWLAATAGLEAYGLPDTTAGRRRFLERLDRRAREEAAVSCGVPPLLAEADARRSHVRRGWYWGSQEFAEKLLRQAGPLLHRRENRTYRSSELAKTHDEARARALLEEGLRAAALARSELKQLPGADGRKVVIALAIRAETNVFNGWIAEQLQMRSAANVSQIVRRARDAGLLNYVD